ncbi:hypothetical protein BWQ96_08126 [Gracilariopsis chorda]|uniref:Uncharacterized protein n=1 Tax=Gracilariopsis chorda TaxID=448386 RepID=A0A2V3IJC2_9FLOR|nr:hypothetical protein BWQ96_08126 [Gracilariopsis chorda]|eukprot:PXF42148.1 hypothetical protein BWQ96_08126 [Gracilariopsis chorda]
MPPSAFVNSAPAHRAPAYLRSGLSPPRRPRHSRVRHAFFTVQLRQTFFLPCITPRTTPALSYSRPIPHATLSDSGNVQDVPEAVIRAIESSRQLRHTVQDIAARSGLSVSDVATQAAKLAALTRTPIDVTETGDLAYRFPSNVRNLLRAASLRAKLRMTWQAVFPPLYSAARLAFGALLIISIVVTFVAIAVLGSAASSSDDDRRSSRSSVMPVRFFAPDIFDIIWYTRATRSYRAEKPPGEMSFLEAVYSFVFGDGDPNEQFETRQYRTIAAIIRSNKGAVTAEQLAPYLDPTFRDGNVVDESYVLPVLQRFNGHPEVTQQGDIIYVFPDFLRSGTSSVEFVGPVSPLEEQLLSLTRATPTQSALAVALGALNVLGVLTLGAKLATVVAVTPDAAAFISLVRSLYPALAAYATSFVLVPLFRWLRQRRVNSAIRKRNAARRFAAERMARADPEIRRKVRAAEQFAIQEGSSLGNVIYSSDKDLLDQKNLQQEIVDDFDRRLKG